MQRLHVGIYFVLFHISKERQGKLRQKLKSDLVLQSKVLGFQSQDGSKNRKNTRFLNSIPSEVSNSLFSMLFFLPFCLARISISGGCDGFLPTLNKNQF